ncbi:MAG: 2-polyprenyl-3-methyl-6-methoxy-1,4-benzoquinone monooxygenase [Burkholderiales bacterium]|nr:2-polyprenyl-3-methyl-6-methoxy-1,4-benzoquinone monooxygenase [Burkholderiales bacterium]
MDKLIGNFDRALRTLFGTPRSSRPIPGKEVLPDPLDESEKRLAGALMRVNHTGEVCAQALYQGQALTARNSELQRSLSKAADEETEHLAWTQHRIAELGGRTSLLNPLFYVSSLIMGATAGALGDKWNLGFLAETERQVVRHLDNHLRRLPASDRKSRAVLEQMREDEADHATQAILGGGVPLPLPIRLAMTMGSKVMTKAAFWI